MRFNKKALQRQLDLAAQELEDKGYSDLADQVDKTNEKLMHASPEEIPAIRARLTKINAEADRRSGKRPAAKTRALSRLRQKARARQPASLQSARKRRIAGRGGPAKPGGQRGLDKKVDFLARRVARLEKLLKD